MIRWKKSYSFYLILITLEILESKGRRNSILIDSFSLLLYTYFQRMEKVELSKQSISPEIITKQLLKKYIFAKRYLSNACATNKVSHREVKSLLIYWFCFLLEPFETTLWIDIVSYDRPSAVSHSLGQKTVMLESVLFELSCPCSASVALQHRFFLFIAVTGVQ